MKIEQSIQIHCPAEKALRLAVQVERFPEFAKGYLTSKIISQSSDQNQLIVRRQVKVQNQVLAWKSRMEKKSKNHFLYTQLEGPLAGMKADWVFSVETPEYTKLTITHILENFTNSKQKKIEETVSQMTDQFLKDIQKWMEAE